ncbi:protein trichome birefringence-like 2 [Papaver somniferum]|uniref:protein trichome birefringence-like 2 n=1 Tax=Papaver somniferum TaxID=3469 RepID=UPI000E6FDF5A|nr:protein trichome birefringence-like 2 [Papaver somniferum]
MRLDLIDPRASPYYCDADIVVFDSWHWWVKNKVQNGKNYFQEGDYLHPHQEISKAYKKALTTWRKWIDKNIDSNKTQVVFRGYSVSHFHGGKWNTGGICNRETEPIASNETYRAKNPLQVKILEDTLRRMKTPVLYLNISELSYYRTDGHPSLHLQYSSDQERTEFKKHQDCVHWCLPGIPDTWNELLYISLMRIGKGSFAQ